MSVCKYCKIENRMRDFRGELLVVERIDIGAIGDIDFEISIAENKHRRKRRKRRWEAGRTPHNYGRL